MRKSKCRKVLREILFLAIVMMALGVFVPGVSRYLDDMAIVFLGTADFGDGFTVDSSSRQTALRKKFERASDVLQLTTEERKRARFYFENKLK